MSRPATEPSQIAAGEIIRLAARAYERDRYLAALLTPRSTREDLIVLAAFAGEIARIPASVTEPMMGEIRLQWWREALGLAEPPGQVVRPSGHPIAEAMQAVISRHALDVTALDTLIDATARLLVDRPHRDMSALLSTTAAIDGTLFAAAHRILSGRALSAPEQAACMAAAEAYGIARVVVEAPVVAGEGRTLLPGDDTAGPTEYAEGCLARIRADWRGLARNVQHAMLPVALVGPYLRLSRDRDGVGRRASLDILPLARVWYLMKAHLLRAI